MRALLLGLIVLSLPLAAGARFVEIQAAPGGSLVACGDLVCTPVLPGEAVVRVEGASRFVFLAATGETLAAGGACASAWLDVPPDAALLALDARPCA